MSKIEWFVVAFTTTLIGVGIGWWFAIGWAIGVGWGMSTPPRNRTG